MKISSLRKVILLYIIPAVFLLSYLIALLLNKNPAVNGFYKVFAGAEFIMIGCLALLEFIIDIYFIRGSVDEDTRSILDKEFLINITIFIFSLMFYGHLRVEISNEVIPNTAGIEPSGFFRLSYAVSIVYGLSLIAWSYRTLVILNRQI